MPARSAKTPRVDLPASASGAMSLQTVIEDAFERRDELAPDRAPAAVRDAVAQALAGLNDGSLRVAAPEDSGWVVWIKGREFMRRWGMARFGLTAFLFLNMLAIMVKMVMRSTFNIKYIMVTPWLNI